MEYECLVMQWVVEQIGNLRMFPLDEISHLEPIVGFRGVYRREEIGILGD